MKSKSTNPTILEVCSGIIQDIWNKNQPPSFRKTPGTCQKTEFFARFCPKIRFFLRYSHLTPFFGLRDIWLNGIISSPCPQVTLDTFGFLVGARWAARRAVFWPRLPKMALFGAKNGIFGPQRPPWRPPCDDFKTKTLPIWCPVMMVTKKLEYVPIIWLQGQKTLYFWPKNQFFSTLRPYDPFFGLRRTRLNGIITSPCPEVTLDTFGFPVGARSAAQRAVFWHRMPKMAFFELKMLFFGPSGYPGVQITTGLAQKSCLFVHQSWC